MTLNVRVEQVCSPSQPAPRIKIQAQDLATVPFESGCAYEWRDSGEPVYLRYAFELTGNLMLHRTRRYTIEEVQ